MDDTKVCLSEIKHDSSRVLFTRIESIDDFVQQLRDIYSEADKTQKSIGLTTSEACEVCDRIIQQAEDIKSTMRNACLEVRISPMKYK